MKIGYLYKNRGDDKTNRVVWIEFEEEEELRYFYKALNISSVSPAQQVTKFLKESFAWLR